MTRPCPYAEVCKTCPCAAEDDVCFPAERRAVDMRGAVLQKHGCELIVHLETRGWPVGRPSVELRERGGACLAFISVAPGGVEKECDYLIAVLRSGGTAAFKAPEFANGIAEWRPWNEAVKVRWPGWLVVAGKGDE